MPAAIEAIARYIDHLEDRAWIEQLVEGHGVPQVLRGISELVVDGAPGPAHNALTLARDLGMRGIVDPDLTSRVRAEMPALLFPSLQRGLQATAYSVRAGVVYTIGKLSFDDQAQLLRDAFEQFLDRDPLLLPRIFFELHWLLPGPEWSYIRRLTEAPHRLIRWSALAAIEPYPCGPGDDALAQKQQTYERLATDPFEPLAAESRHRLAALLRGTEADGSPQLVKPGLTFEAVELRFTNRLPPAADYTIEELDAFVVSLMPRSRDE
ncbi:hypothetical protein OV090_06965 [Nannocystis sp. RBIL2]|uniref:hypothetical protein n=1 Tax=Nannocystis sp. RBIL2 TaxID=2996788 RepID=UPI0022718B2E|nr:hypothetical protein [Nannocystis sp. RBIL2]MCY1064494.1 hypothetical protein [Nannocystis sp. RBIL2]